MVRTPKAAAKPNREKNERPSSDVTCQAQNIAGDPAKKATEAIDGPAFLDPYASLRRNPAALLNGAPQNLAKTGLRETGITGPLKRQAFVGVGHSASGKSKDINVGAQTDEESNDVKMQGATAQKTKKKRPKYRKCGSPYYILASLYFTTFLSFLILYCVVLI